MIVTIELAEEKVRRLRAQAEAEGLTLQSWLEKVADEQASRESGSVLEEMRRIRSIAKADPEGWTVRDYVSYGRR